LIADYSITFACLNQLAYTQQFLQSLAQSGADLKRVVAVNNASQDDTFQYLSALGLGGVINNKTNLGCGAAWNQGVLALQSEWTIIINNDVLVPPNFVEDLIKGAKTNGLLVASPAMIEAPSMSYDLAERSLNLSQSFHGYYRKGFMHGVCMLVHASVWERVGYFRAKPRLLGYEDSLFFRDLEDHQIPRGTISSTWIHHFGSVTQRGLKKERQLPSKASLGDRGDYELHRDGWLGRKWRKIMARRDEKRAVAHELTRFKDTLIQSEASS
jgi:GT2 family glycosyltransferase